MQDARYATAGSSLSSSLGRWAHLGVVYDANRQIARLYINGRCDLEEDLPESILALLGPAQIGNWQSLPKFPLRPLSGRVDEFVALSRALSPDEIESYYRATTPYQLKN